MKTEHGVTVKYTKLSTDINWYDSGLCTWVNLDNCYLGEACRDKVVCKFDAIKLLTRYFEPETLDAYRDVILMIANGEYTVPEQYSAIINALIQKDKTFEAEIVRIFHSCPEDECFGVYIVKVLAGALLSIEREYRSFFRGKPEVVICLSGGYLYFSFEDSYRGPVLPDKVECEVLSYVKNWRGNINFLE